MRDMDRNLRTCMAKPSIYEWLRSKPRQVERLAALIREVDGGHTLAAAELAEALVSRGVTVQLDHRGEL